ncbi:hypothetical protein ACB092_M014000 [Castanea dentata]
MAPKISLLVHIVRIFFNHKCLAKGISFASLFYEDESESTAKGPPLTSDPLLSIHSNSCIIIWFDLGWDHGVKVNSRQVQCNYCKEIHSGGIYRLKHRLTGTRKNVSACPSVPGKVKEKFMAVLNVQAEASIKKKRWYTIEEEENGNDDELVEVQQLHSSKGRGRHIGSMDKFFYTSAIPFNCVKNPKFLRMIDMISRFGIGLKPPSYHEIRETCLKEEVDFTQQMLEEYKSDKKRRSICNFLVNSPKGTIFLYSIDTSNISKIAEKVCQMLDEVVDRKRKCLFWTPCATHCLDLMLEDFEKNIKDHKAMLLNWLWDFTKGRELIRPAATRIATSYLTLSGLNEFKGELMTMFSSEQWRCSKFAKTKEGKRIHAIVMDNNGFWRLVVKCLKAAIPLLKRYGILLVIDGKYNLIGLCLLRDTI